MRVAIWSLVSLMLSFPAHGQWERTVFSGKGESHDTPSAHPLRYFTDDPFTRDDADEFCVKCSSPDGKGREARASGRYSIQAEPEQIGALEGFRIWDVRYRIQEEGAGPGRIEWKSILVETGPDRYVEIYHLQAFGPAPDLAPARIVQSGDESVLATDDPDGGNAGGCWESYWWFDQAGPQPIDFSSLRPVIAGHLPAGAVFRTTCAAVHLQDREIKSWVQKANAECHACDYLGEVTAHFRLHGSQVEAAAVAFKPGPEP